MNLKTSLLAVVMLIFGAALFFTVGAPQAAATVASPSIGSAGTTWYVDANVAASGSGTAASPFKTITEAIAAAGNGDTVYLQNGTYAPSTNGETYPIASGTELKFEGQSQDGVILDEEKANPEAFGYMFTSAANSEFTKMTFTGYYSALYISAGNSSVTYCTFQGNYDGAMRGSSGLLSLGSGDYSHNIFHDNRSWSMILISGFMIAPETYSATADDNEIKNESDTPYTKSPMGIYFIGSATASNNLTVTNNNISGKDGKGLLTYGIMAVTADGSHNNFVAEGNTLTGFLYGIISYSVAGTNDYQISNNYIAQSDSLYRDTGSTSGITLGEAGDTTISSQIYNNVLANAMYGLTIDTDPAGTTKFDNHLVSNNTIHDIYRRAIGVSSESGGLSNQTVVTTQNNVISKAETGLDNGVNDPPIKTFTSDYNDFYDISGDSYIDVKAGDKDRQIDPEFADKDNADYTLNPSSLLIDAGTSDSAPTDDLEGTKRPQGRGFDIGAYESIDWSGTFRIGNGYIATAPASSGGPQYKFFKYDGTQVYKAINAFNTDWRSEFKVQTADINDDGLDEIVAYAGAGVEPKLRVYKKNGDRLAEITALSPGFRGGLNAVTGDFNNDGKIEIAVAPAASGGPQVQVYKYDKGKLALLTQFLAYPGTFRGGLTLAAGDTDANGYKSIITAPSSGGGPDVRVYRYESGKFVKKAAILAYGSGNRDGVNLTSVDMNRDGKDEVITAPMNGKSNVRVYREESSKLKLLDWKMIYGDTFAGGVNLSSGDVNADRKGEIVLTPAHSGGPNLMIYRLTDQNKLEKVTNKTVYSSTMRAGYKTAVGDLNDDGTSEIAIVPTAPQTSNVQVFTFASNKLQKIKSFMAYANNFRGGINLAIGGR